MPFFRLSSCRRWVAPFTLTLLAWMPMGVRGEELSIAVVPQAVEPKPAGFSISETIKVRLKAGPNGELTSVQIMNNPPMVGPNALAELNKKAAQMTQFAALAGQGAPKYDLQIDDALRYEFVLRALIAVSKQTTPDGAVSSLTSSVRLQTANFGADANQVPVIKDKPQPTGVPVGDVNKFNPVKP